MTPIIRLYPGYNPSSTTLEGPLRTKGRVQGSVEIRESPSRMKLKRVEPACMGEDMPPGTMVWYDTSAELENGRLALYWKRDEDGRVLINCKRLFLTEGQWFAACHYYILPVTWIVGVVGWAAIVAEMQFPGSCYVPGRNTQEIYDSQAEEDAWRAELNGQPINQRAIARLTEMLEIPQPAVPNQLSQHVRAGQVAHFQLQRQTRE